MVAALLTAPSCKKTATVDAGAFGMDPAMAALAEKAVQPTEERTIELLGTPRVELIPGVQCEVTEFKSVTAVRTPRLSLTSMEGFAMLRVKIQNALKQGIDLDLARFVLERGDKRFELARDAQAAAGTQPLVGALAPGGDVTMTLYFEIPREELAPGLRLRIGAPRGDAGVVLDLQ